MDCVPWIYVPDDLKKHRRMLDKDIQIFLQLTKSDAYASFKGSGVELVRKNVKRLAAVMALPGEPVAKVKDIDIAADAGGEIGLRLYWPVETPGLMPALVYYHGGGFVLYDRDDYDGFCRRLSLSAAVVIVSVDYRRAPEHRFPAAHMDAEAALKWVCENAAELRIDPERISVGGDSAGGNLAATLAARQAVHGVPLAWQVLIYPALTFNRSFPSYDKYGEGFLLDTQTMHWFFDLFKGEEEGSEDDPRLHPYCVEDPGMQPPVIMAVAEYDILRDEGIDHYRRMAGVNRGSRLLYFDNLGHNFLLMAGRIEAAREAIDSISRVLKECLHAKETVRS